MQHKKDIVEELTQLKNMGLFTTEGKLKRNLDNKFLIKNARRIATGFEKSDLRKKPSKNEIKKARKVIKEFVESIRYHKIKIIRPSKKNRAIYARYADLPTNFKYIAMPILDETTTFKIKNKRIIRKSQFSDTEFFPFENINSLVKNPLKETQKTFKEIKKKYKGQNFQVTIKCGRAEYHHRFEDDDHVAEQVDLFLSQYGAISVRKWCIGLNAYVFNNQDIDGAIFAIKKKKEKRKNKYQKAKGR